MKKFYIDKCPICKGKGFIYIDKYSIKFKECPCCEEGKIKVIEKKLTCACGKMATWFYMATYKDLACCDDCVPRSCTCNQYDYYEFKPDGFEYKDWCWTHIPNVWEELDGNGNKLPCCEWLYNEQGWDIDEDYD